MCNHKRVGIVTNQPNGYDPGLPHASESVCARAACIEGAIRRVAGRTNMTAYFREDMPRPTRQLSLIGLSQ